MTFTTNTAAADTSTTMKKTARKTKMMAMTLALTLGVTSVAAIATPDIAEAKNGRNAAAAAGLIFGLAAGAAIASQPRYDHGPTYTRTKVCQRERSYNRYRGVWEVRRVCWYE